MHVHDRSKKVVRLDNTGGELIVSFTSCFCDEYKTDNDREIHRLLNIFKNTQSEIESCTVDLRDRCRIQDKNVKELKKLIK